MNIQSIRQFLPMLQQSKRVMEMSCLNRFMEAPEELAVGKSLVGCADFIFIIVELPYKLVQKF
jgi:hypothetical protein